MSVNNCTVTDWLAFGYHMAALRGEAPLEATPENVAAWIETRPVYELAARKFKTDGRLEQWKVRMARMVVKRLERIGVAR